MSFDMNPVRAILGKRISGVMLKRRKADTKHPENRMFFMFDDGSGFEFFCGGGIFPWDIHRDCDYKHEVRHRIDEGKYTTTFLASEPEGDDKKIDLDSLFKKKIVASNEESYDKHTIAVVIGKRIQGLRLQQDTRKGHTKILDLIFIGGTVFEFRIIGYVCACSKLESFDLHRLIKRGSNAYENEVLVLKDPDGDGHAVVINKLYKWPETGEGNDRK